MAVSFVSSISQTGGTVSPTITFPAGIVAGDIIIYVVTNGSTTNTISTPTGYTLLRTISDGTAQQTCIFWKAANGTTDAQSFTESSAARWVTTIAVYRGVDNTTPFIVENGQAESGTTVTVHSAPAITNTDANAWGVFYASTKGVSTTSWTAGAGLTEREDIDGTLTTSANEAATWADSNGTVATGAKTYSSTASGGSSIGTQWAAFLAPAATGSSFSGSLALSGSGTATFSGTPGVTNTLARTGSGSMVPTATVAFSGSLPTAGSGSASFSGKPGFSGTLNLSGSGSLTFLAGGGTGSGNLALSGSGALTASGVPGFSGTLALSSFGSLSMSGTKTEAPLPSFTPPTHPTSIPHKGMWSYYSIPEGQSVVRINGVLTLHPYPSMDDLKGLTPGKDYFLGGRTYDIDSATATELQNAGFTTNA